MSKTIFSTGLLLLFLALTNCGQEIKKKRLEEEKNTVDESSILDSLKIWGKTLHDLDEASPNFIESATILNKKIKNSISAIQDTTNLKILTTSFGSDSLNVSLIQSQNEQFNLFFWDTRLGGAMGQWGNVVLLVNDGKVVSENLNDHTLVYDAIYTLQDSYDIPVYLIMGRGKISSYESYEKLEAFYMDGDSLKKANIFPEDKSSWKCFAEPGDLHGVHFKIDMDGSHILKPEWLGDSEVWQPYTFDGNSYNPELFQLNGILSEQYFDTDKDINFIQGSELVKSTTEEGDNTLFIFDDSITVVEKIDHQEEVTNYTIFNKNGETVDISFDFFANLIGKKQNHLFFNMGGVPESWELLVYDINQKKMIFSYQVAKAMLYDGNLVFSELLDIEKAQKLGPNLCDNSLVTPLRYFEIHVVSFDQKHPILQPSGQGYCGYVQ